MSKEEFENWQKIKDHLEAEELTDTTYYKRAVAILEGKGDPLTLPLLDEE